MRVREATGRGALSRLDLILAIVEARVPVYDAVHRQNRLKEESAAEANSSPTFRLRTNIHVCGPDCVSGTTYIRSSIWRTGQTQCDGSAYLVGSSAVHWGTEHYQARKSTASDSCKHAPDNIVELLDCLGAAGPLLQTSRTGKPSPDGLGGCLRPDRAATSAHRL